MDPYIENLKRMTPAAKLQAAARLYDSTRELKRAAIEAQHPDASPEELRRLVREAFTNVPD